MNGGGTPPAFFLSGAVPLTGANVGGGMDDLDLEEILNRLPSGVAATPSQPTTAVATPAAAAGERAPPPEPTVAGKEYRRRCCRPKGLLQHRAQMPHREDTHQ